MIDETCSVCGRTVLAGEQTRVYFAEDGERREVCELCRYRAEELGWTWEREAAIGLDPEPASSPRWRSGLGALRGLFVRTFSPSPASEEPGQPVGAEQPSDRGDSHSPDPAARGATVGRSDQTDPDGPDRVERAVELFNRSEQAGTVAGLVRTLGAPWASIGAGEGSGEVRITVAWELTWYQWSLNPDRGEGHPHQVASGTEIGQLDSSARHWNAVAGEGGRLSLSTTRHAGGTDRE